MRNDKWMKGEFYFMALIRYKLDEFVGKEWALTRNEFFESKEQAQAKYLNYEVKWPAEDLDGVIFCPDPEELE